MHKIQQLEEEHELKVTEIKQSSEVKLKELSSQQNKYAVTLEASEKEIKLLKEEVKALKVIDTLF